MIFSRINGALHLVRQETGREPVRIYLGWEELERLKECCTMADVGYQAVMAAPEEGQVGLFLGIPVFEVKTRSHVFAA